MDERQLQALFARLDSMLQGVRQYIGARYVPRFVGTYDPTQSYEALDVVDNGSGTSYIAKIPTPANTPLTDTDHWFLYGSSSGAIVNLQHQIDDMKDGTVPGSLQEQINENTSHITALTALITGKRIGVLSQYTSAGNTLDDALNDDNISILILDEDAILTTRIDIDRNTPLTVFGFNHMISSSKISLIRVINGTSNLTFKDIVFKVNDYTKADSTACTILEIYPIDYTQIASKNIRVINCDFSGGNIAFVASYAANVIIEKCHFHDIHFPTGAGSGGYAILTQIVQNCYIKDNVFDYFNEGRHDIYISTMPGVTTGPSTKNIFIVDNVFDHSVFNSDSLDCTSIQIRQGAHIIIDNNHFIEIGRLLTIARTNYDVTGIELLNTLVDYIRVHTAVDYKFIDIGGTDNACDINISNLIVKAASNAVTHLYAYKASLRGNHIYFYNDGNMTLGGTIDCNIDDMIMHNSGYTALNADPGAIVTGHIDLRTYGGDNKPHSGVAALPLSFFCRKAYFVANAILNDNIATFAASCVYNSGTGKFDVTFQTLDSITTQVFDIYSRDGLIKDVSTSGNVLSFKVVDENGTAFTSFRGYIEVVRG